MPFIDRLHGWITTVDHKRLGLLYIGYALLFLVVGGLEAAVMRIQLMGPQYDVVSPQVFNRLFTMHGTTMIFFVAMPLVFGFANYLVPLMIGARDMAFPRLNAFSFWLTAFGGLLLYFSVVGAYGLYGAGNAPDVGWFAYAPLTSLTFSPGHSTDYWTLSLLVSGFGSIGGAVNIITTIVCLRCPGMTLGRMPLFVWLSLVMAVLVILAIGPLSAAQMMLLIDRYLGGHFFDTQAGGSATIWMHFFWIFGHPEVYVLVLPAFGIASEDHPGVLAKTDLRLCRHGRCHGLHRVHRDERLGASHVHDRHVIVGERLFRVDDDGDCGADGDQDLQLAGDDVGRQDRLPGADAVLHRVPPPVPRRWLDRCHARLRPLRLAARELVFRRRAFSLRDRRRHSVHACLPGSTTGFRR